MDEFIKEFEDSLEDLTEYVRCLEVDLYKVLVLRKEIKEIKKNKKIIKSIIINGVESSISEGMVYINVTNDFLYVNIKDFINNRKIGNVISVNIKDIKSIVISFNEEEVLTKISF